MRLIIYNMLNKHTKLLFISLLITVFISNNYVQSVVVNNISTFIPTTAGKSVDSYLFTNLVGMKFDKIDSFEISFMVTPGKKEVNFDNNEDYIKFAKYFLAALTIPEEHQWVNLSPYEKDRIIEEDFSRTDMGKDLLSQDYVLKQLAAELISPNNEVGKKFWAKVNKEVYDIYGKDLNISLDIFNKIWITPDTAYIHIDNGYVWIVESSLKVMLEKDYLAHDKHKEMSTIKYNYTNDDVEINSFIYEYMREILIPALEKEVNQGEHFIVLRQIYHSMILATWYKENYKDSRIGNRYINKSKIKGIKLENANKMVSDIYNKYSTAFSFKETDAMNEEYDPNNQSIIVRKYISGGFDLSTIVPNEDKSLQSTPTDVKSVEFRLMAMETKKFIEENVVYFRIIKEYFPQIFQKNWNNLSNVLIVNKLAKSISEDTLEIIVSIDILEDELKPLLEENNIPKDILDIFKFFDKKRMDYARGILYKKHINFINNIEKCIKYIRIFIEEINSVIVTIEANINNKLKDTSENSTIMETLNNKLENRKSDIKKLKTTLENFMMEVMMKKNYYPHGNKKIENYSYEELDNILEYDKLIRSTDTLDIMKGIFDKFKTLNKDTKELGGINLHPSLLKKYITKGNNRPQKFAQKVYQNNESELDGLIPVLRNVSLFQPPFAKVKTTSP